MEIFSNDSASSGKLCTNDQEVRRTAHLNLSSLALPTKPMRSHRKKNGGWKVSHVRNRVLCKQCSQMEYHASQSQASQSDSPSPHVQPWVPKSPKAHYESECM